uniref:Leucine-rich repeat-containing protein 51 n=1 Tax=Globodera pallida TaxID=36090 RepID=A0A183CLN4_GLOPA
MLQSSTHCARKISRRLSPFVPGSVYGSGCNADELLRKASRKLSQLSELGELHHHGSSTGETESLNGAGSEVSGADSSDCSTTDDLTVLDCSNLNLEQLPVELLTEHSEDIEHLILDENELDEQALEDIPRLDKLETLSLNGNQIKNIGVLLQYLKRKCPNLKFLSLIGNPGWPHPILNDNLQLYRTYALSAVRLFPSLQFLDTARLGS